MSGTVQNILTIILIIAMVMATYSFRLKKTKALKIQFSLEEVRCYKGLFAVFIVLDHLWMQHHMISLSLFHESAVILVTIYFFFSGYGISTRTAKDAGYMGTGFWKKRITGVLLPMVIVDLLAVLYQCLQGGKVGLEMLVPYLTGKGLVNGQTWYIRELLVCYLFFYLLVKIDSSPKKVMIGCAVLLTVMNIVLILCGYGYAWYGSSYGFLIGIYCGYSGGGYTKIQKENHMLPIVLTGSFVLTAVLSVVYKVIGRESILNMLLVRNVMTSAATVFFISAVGLLVVRPRKYDVVSAVSMEIYLLHMLVIDICIGTDLEKYPCLLVLVVVAVTVVSSNCFHKILGIFRK